jgi:hypothetical protein
MPPLKTLIPRSDRLVEGLARHTRNDPVFIGRLKPPKFLKFSRYLVDRSPLVPATKTGDGSVNPVLAFLFCGKFHPRSNPFWTFLANRGVTYTAAFDPVRVGRFPMDLIASDLRSSVIRAEHDWCLIFNATSTSSQVAPSDRWSSMYRAIASRAV